MPHEFLTLDQAFDIARLPQELKDGVIEYDPEVDPQYHMRRGSIHDGTLLFTVELMQRTLVEMLNGMTFYKPMGMPLHPKMLVYTVGRIKRFWRFGKYDVNGNVIEAMRERVSIPVRVRWKDSTSPPQEN